MMDNNCCIFKEMRYANLMSETSRHVENSRPNIYIFQRNRMMDNKCFVKNRRYANLMKKKEISCWKMRCANVIIETSRPNICILKKKFIMENEICMFKKSRVLKKMRYANLMEK